MTSGQTVSAGAGRPALGDVALQPMRRRDIPAVLAIERRCYPTPWSADLFASELGHPDRSYIVAVRPEQGAWRTRRRIVGYGGIMVAVDEAHITTVATHPAHHRQKIASRILLQLLREARRRGAVAATLEVRAANLGAQRLYSQFGFAPVGIRPRYYSAREDAVIMWAYDLGGDEMTARLAAQEARLREPGGASGSVDLPVPWVEGRIGLREGAL